MRASRCGVAIAFLVVAVSPAAAQPDAPALSPLQTAIACAAPPVLDPPSGDRFRIVGAQDTTPRALFGNRDLLIVGAGTKKGLQLGQEFFVRRPNTFGAHGGEHGRGVKTIAWVRLVAVNDTTAIAQVEHACGGVLADDYLDPYVAPVVPSEVDTAGTADAGGEPDFAALGRVVGGSEDRAAVGAGDFALIDRGAQDGVTPGQRFAAYRDVGLADVPLAAVGELVVVSTGQSASLVRVVRSRDAILAGDYVAPRK